MWLGLLRKKAIFGLAKKQVSNHSVQDQEKDFPSMFRSVSDNLKMVKELTGNSGDILMHEFTIEQNKDLAAALVIVDGLTDARTVNDNIIEPLIKKTGNRESSHKNATIRDIAKSRLSVSEIKEVNNFGEVAEGFLNGNSVLFIDGFPSALVINCKGWEKRNISVPSSESVIRGPRESFTENMITNTSMIRRKIKNPDLTIEMSKIGVQTRTSVCLVYMKGLADQTLIRTVRKRLENIEVGSILESGYIEQYIEDAPFSIFSTIGHTEKPDVLAAKLLEGRIGIIVDGTPIVLTAPLLFIENFQTAEDYYSRPYYMSMVRIIRYIAFLISVFVPALYVAITTFDQELIPTNLLFTMTAARESIPFPAVGEALIMLTAFEILREAGIRLPQPIGQAMSIVGALVIGESAVSAGLIGAPMVIVVALTSVAIFATPQLNDSASILRLIYLILAGTMGGYGVIIGTLGTLVHLSSLKSFGFPFLSPLAPFVARDNKDAIVRFPLWLMLSRPKGMAKRNEKREDFIIPPTEPSNYNSEE